LLLTAEGWIVRLGQGRRRKEKGRSGVKEEGGRQKEYDFFLLPSSFLLDRAAATC
jgi:hypothetical protein